MASGRMKAMPRNAVPGDSADGAGAASVVDKSSKRYVLALQSGLKSEVSWALNALTVISFKEKDDPRRDFGVIAKVPGLLDALLFVIQEWRDIAHPRDSAKLARQRVLGANHTYTGWGMEFESTCPGDPIWRLRSAPDTLLHKDEIFGDADKQSKNSEWWWDEEGVFNLDELGRLERQQAAVAASNIVRNFSFMPENESFMAQHRNCLETLIHCMQDHLTEDEELVMNSIETIVNLAPFLCIKLFEDSTRGQISEKQAVQSFIDMLESPVRAWYCSAAELLGRLVVNPDNEPYLLPVAPQVYRRLVDLLGLPGADGQAAAVGALYNFAEINMDCRVRLANERWAIGRLLRIVQAPHPLTEVVRKAALTLESLASEPQNRTVMLAFENTFAEIALLDARMSDIFARILWELCSRTNVKAGATRGVWGS